MAKAAVRKAAVRVVITNQYEEVLLQKRDADVRPYPGRWCTFGGEVRDEDSDWLDSANRILWGELNCGPSMGASDLHIVTGHPAGGWEYTDEVGEWELYYVQWPSYRGHISRFHLQQGAGMAWWTKAELLTLAPEMLMRDAEAIGQAMGWVL